MKNTVRIVILSVALGFLILGYYFYLSKQGSTTENSVAVQKQTEIQKVLEKDLVNSYPETPRSVIKWYNRIQMLYYDENTSESDLEALCDQAMLMMDADLLQMNPKEVYVTQVKDDVADYKNHNRKIVSIEVADTANVEYVTKDGRDYAYVQVYYFLKEGSNFQNTYQKYCLRKDDGGKWKILAIELTDGDGDSVAN